MKVAAYQAPLLAAGSMDAIGLIRSRVAWCEAEGVSILCCPEAILGGLADYSAHPTQFALAADTGALEAALAPLASDTVTTIVGYTELADGGRLYNAAAVFQVDGLTFGIVICNDSNYAEPARLMAAQGATALFVPTNNGLPPTRAGAKLVAAARNVDIARAIENHMWVIRADVAGRTDELVAYGSSGIVDPDGRVLQSARQLDEDLLVVEIGTAPRIKTTTATADALHRPHTARVRT
jgi:predicted amidohydrolase